MGANIIVLWRGIRRAGQGRGQVASVAIYYYAMARVGRGGGRSAVASAAYLSRAQYRDEVHDRVYDERAHIHDERASAIAAASHYIGRKGRHGADRDPPLFEGLYGPPGAPEWTRGKENIERFWNEAERAEKHPRAQLAESVIIGLPHELSLQQNVWMLQDHIREFTRQGRVVQLAIHAPDREGDQRNLHAHLLISTRGVDEHGMKPTKTREQQERYLGRSDYLDRLRENWGHVANRHLARHGFEAGLDHRSYERQGSRREAHWHIGPGDMRKERQGERTRFGEHNREVAARNAEREAIGREIRHLEAEVIELAQVRAERQKAEATRGGARSAKREWQAPDQARRRKPPRAAILTPGAAGWNRKRQKCRARPRKGRKLRGHRKPRRRRTHRRTAGKGLVSAVSLGELLVRCAGPAKRRSTGLRRGSRRSNHRQRLSIARPSAPRRKPSGSGRIRKSCSRCMPR